MRARPWTARIHPCKPRPDGGGYFLFLAASSAALVVGLQGVEFVAQFALRLPIHAVDEKDAVQVVGLVLHGAGEQAAAAEFNRLALFIEGLHLHGFRARDVRIHFRETQATLRAGDGFAHGFDLRD